jgi:hypothetical protein
MLKRIPRVRPRTAVPALIAGLGLVALAASPAAASASVLTPNTCAATATGQPFSQWGDNNQYELMTGGDFAGAASGWTLTGGATVVSDSSPWNLAGVDPAGSLYLPAGATAQSPYICVDPQDPTYRLLDSGGSSSTSLAVQAVYRTVLGIQLPVTLNPVATSSSWAPTDALPTGAAPLSLLGGGTAQMSLRFTAGPGGAYIDDVFVDPLMHR